MFKLIIIILLSFSMKLYSNNSSLIEIKARYNNALTGEIQRKVSSVTLPKYYDVDDLGLFTSNDGIKKTLLVIELANAIENSLKDFEVACRKAKRTMPTLTKPMVRIPNRPRRQHKPDCQSQKKEIGETLLGKVSIIEQNIETDYQLLGDSTTDKMITLANNLASNIIEFDYLEVKHSNNESGIQTLYPDKTVMDSSKPSRPINGEKGFLNAAANSVTSITTTGIFPTIKKSFAPLAAGLQVVAGGAADIGHFSKLVNDGEVPESRQFVVEGFLNEFYLPLIGISCDELICFNPAIAVDENKNKLFVQVDMKSNVTPESFERKPLNLSIVLDVSGSMRRKDKTIKRRIEWAKEAAITTIKSLNKGEVVSVVIFNQESKVLIDPHVIKNTKIAPIIKAIKAIEAGGSTNLYKGLQDGYKLVSKNIKFNFENRVLLISDARFNMGITDKFDYLRLVTAHSTNNIGLTAVGLGSNFNQDFIHGITMSKGGRYIFVNSGKGMQKYFSNFKYLMTPIAYGLTANVKRKGFDQAKLVKTYGLPGKIDEEVSELINIQTLFFGSEGGGAILLEYDLSH